MTAPRKLPPEDAGSWEVKSRYEIVFSIFLLALAFLFRNHASIVYPEILYVFVFFMSFNLAYNLYLKQKVRATPLAFSPVFVNGILITWALHYSGGTESYLWVMYLLPIFTACLLYDNRGIVLSTTYVLALYASVYGSRIWGLDGIEGLQFFGKLSLLVLSAAVTARLAAVERAMESSRAARRRRFDTSLGRLWGESAPGAKEEEGTLFSMAVHDVNAALAVVLGSSQLLRAQEDSNDGRLEDLARIDSSVRLGKVVLQNLVLLGKMDADWPLEEVSVSTIVEEALDQCRAEIRSKRILLEESPAPSTGDNGFVSVPLLRQAFLNLLFAAIAATPSGGRIRVSACPVRDNGGPHFEFVVEDGGARLGEEDQTHFFDPHWLAPGRGKGVGLGIYLAMEIIKNHEGRLDVVPSKGTGNRLTARLPLKRMVKEKSVRLSNLSDR